MKISDAIAGYLMAAGVVYHLSLLCMAGERITDWWSNR